MYLFPVPIIYSFMCACLGKMMIVVDDLESYRIVLGYAMLHKLQDMIIEKRFSSTACDRIRRKHAKIN